MQYIVFWINNRRIGSAEKTAYNIMQALDLMRLSFIQEDITGTIHYEIRSVKL